MERRQKTSEPDSDVVRYDVIQFRCRHRDSPDTVAFIDLWIFDRVLATRLSVCDTRSALFWLQVETLSYSRRRSLNNRVFSVIVVE